MIKKLGLILVFALMIFSVFNVKVSAQENEDGITKKELEASIESQLGESEYNKYLSLSESDKDKFVSYLNDETLMDKVSESLKQTTTFNLADTNGSQTNIIKVNEDITIEENAGDAPAKVKAGEFGIAATQYRDAWFTKNISFFGIKVFEHKSTLAYSRTAHGGKILGIQGSDHFVNRNFTVNRITYTGKTHRKGTTWAESKGNHQVSLLVKGEWSYDSGRQSIKVDNKGNVTGYFLS